jgi:hypothetical protein
MTRRKIPGLGKKIATIGLLGLAIIVFAFSFYKEFVRTHLDLPVGCDEFGYLYLAKGIRDGRPFTTPTARPFDPALTKALLASDFALRSYSHLIAPHAYHLDPAAGKVINQYPPGTSLLLGLLPFDSAKRLSPPLFALFSLVFIVLGLFLRERRFTLFDAGLAVLVMVFILAVNPFRSSFADVNSIAPSLGLLIAAGYLLDKKPGASLVFLGLATVFRIVSALLVIPILAVYVLRTTSARLFSAQALVRAAKGALLFFLGGVWIYIAYVWVLLGSPFRPTYSYIDQAWTLKGATANAAFYFSFHQPWFVVHLALLTLLTLAAVLRRTPWKWVGFAFGLTVLNYAYYLFHEVQIAYYPFASAMVLLGLFLGQLAALVRELKPGWVIPAAATLVLLLLVRSTSHKFPRQDFQALFQDKVRPYTETFSKYDVVWAELRSGTVEYTTGKAGFRFTWGPPRQRDTVMRWLRGYGYKQAIWVSDLPVGRAEIEQELKDARLKYEVVTTPAFGTLLEIRPRNRAGEAAEGKVSGPGSPE